MPVDEAASKNGWEIEIVMRTKGPKEGWQTKTFRQEDTTHENVKVVQNTCIKALLSLEE